MTLTELLTQQVRTEKIGTWNYQSMVHTNNGVETLYSPTIEEAGIYILITIFEEAIKMAAVQEMEMIKLQNENKLLQALLESGVDNWEGFADAQMLVQAWERE